MTNHESPGTERAWIERTSVLPADGDLWEPLALLGRVRDPHLAPLVRVSPVPGGSTVTHLVPAGCVPLSSLRAAAPLRAGHVVTVVLAVVEALAALHDAGLAHGGVDLDQVLLAPDGGVVLGGTGLAWRLAPGARGGPRPVDDVDAVGELVRDLLGDGGGASALVIASLRASDPDPEARPDVDELRELITRSASPAPLLELLWTPPEVRIDPRTPPTAPGAPVSVAAAARTATVGQDDEIPLDAGVLGRRASSAEIPARVRRDGRRSRSSRRRTPSGRAIVVVALLGALALLAALVRSGRTAEAATSGVDDAAPSSTSSPAVAPIVASASPERVASSQDPASSAAGPAGVDLDRAGSSVDWLAVVDAVDARRSLALAAGSLTDLARVVDPTGAAWVADAALARRIAAARATVQGGGLEVDDLRVVSADDRTAVLLVRDRRAGYSVTVGGRVTRVAERGERWWRVRLARDDSGWRIEEVTGVDDADVPGPSATVSTPRAP